MAFHITAGMESYCIHHQLEQVNSLCKSSVDDEVGKGSGDVFDLIILSGEKGGTHGTNSLNELSVLYTRSTNCPLSTWPWIILC